MSLRVEAQRMMSLREGFKYGVNVPSLLIVRIV